MNMFVVLDQDLEQAHGRNKTYKTIRGAIDNGIHEWGGPTPLIESQTDDYAVVKYNKQVFYVVNVGWFAKGKAKELAK